MTNERILRTEEKEKGQRTEDKGQRTKVKEQRKTDKGHIKAH